MANNDVSRRQFFTKLMGIPVLGAVTAPLAAVGGYVWPPERYTTPPKPYAVPGAEKMNVGDVMDFDYDGVGSTLIKKSENEYLALSRKCKHLGCTAKYEANNKRFFCPCHGGTYDAEGNPTGGPPPAPLDKWKVEPKDGKIFVSVMPKA